MLKRKFRNREDDDIAMEGKRAKMGAPVDGGDDDNDSSIHNDTSDDANSGDGDDANSGADGH